jgi:hypothetical protein
MVEATLIGYDSLDEWKGLFINPSVIPLPPVSLA